MTTKMKEEWPCYAWDVVVLVRKGLLAVFTAVFAEDKITYYMLSLVILVLAGCAQQRWLPFALQSANLVESMTILSSTLLFVQALAEMVDQSAQSVAGSGYVRDLVNSCCTLAVFFTVIWTSLVIIGRIYAGWWLWKKRSKMEEQLKAQDDATVETLVDASAGA
eukprot:COSAG02_NODE_17876_length_974_cov_1.200000_1_plen_163_part_10